MSSDNSKNRLDNLSKKCFVERYQNLFSILIGAIITIVGWCFISSSNIERDRIDKLNEIKNMYISNAYKVISFSSTLMRFNRLSKDDFIKLEGAFKDIQLYGSKKEIELAQELIDSISQQGSYRDFDPLLNTLRDNLRTHYELEILDNNTYWVMDTTFFPVYDNKK